MFKLFIFIFLVNISSLQANEKNLQMLIEQQYPDIKIQSIKKLALMICMKFIWEIKSSIQIKHLNF